MLSWAQPCGAGAKCPLPSHGTLSHPHSRPSSVALVPTETQQLQTHVAPTHAYGPAGLTCRPVGCRTASGRATGFCPLAALLHLLWPVSKMYHHELKTQLFWCLLGLCEGYHKQVQGGEAPGEATQQAQQWGDGSWWVNSLPSSSKGDFLVAWWFMQPR